MLESESSALPFGDSPITTTSAIIHESSGKCKRNFQFFSIFLYLPILIGIFSLYVMKRESEMLEMAGNRLILVCPFFPHRQGNSRRHVSYTPSPPSPLVRLHTDFPSSDGRCRRAGSCHPPESLPMRCTPWHPA